MDPHSLRIILKAVDQEMSLELSYCYELRCVTAVTAFLCYKFMYFTLFHLLNELQCVHCTTYYLLTISC